MSSSDSNTPSPHATAGGRGTAAPKSILKKPTGTQVQAGTPLPPPPPPSPLLPLPLAMGRATGGGGGRRQGPRSAEEARAIAVHHAQVLENRKQLELSILASIEHLLEYPPTSSMMTAAAGGGAGAGAGAGQQLSGDVVSEFKRQLAHFRPADLDDLVEERNIVRKCGYPLCARSNTLQQPITTTTTTAAPAPAPPKYRVLFRGSAGSPIVVEARRLERFCSDDCARRALWIRVQLSDQPAWLRPSGAEPSITLLEEEKNRAPCSASRLADPMFRANLGKLADELRNIGISNTGLANPNLPPQAPPREEEEEDALAEKLERVAISETEAEAEAEAEAECRSSSSLEKDGLSPLLRTWLCANPSSFCRGPIGARGNNRNGPQ